MPLRVAKLTFRRRPMCATLAFASRRVISPRRTIRPFLREESAECVPFQEEVGLDVLVHGQFQHNDTVIVKAARHTVRRLPAKNHRSKA